MGSAVGVEHDEREQLKNAIAQRSIPFSDDEFLPNDASLGTLPRKELKVEWCRARVVCGEELFPPFGPHSCDVMEGELSDCYIMAAASALGVRGDYLRAIFLGYNPGAGMAAIQVWRNSRPMVIVVDDLIPCSIKSKYDESDPNVEVLTKVPLFGRTKSGAVWLPLLEKAMAKYYGSYAALIGGNVSEALRDLSSECVIDFNLSKMQVQALETLHKSYQPRCLEKSACGGCAFVTSDFTSIAMTPNGVLENHAYSILNIALKRPSRDKNKERGGKLPAPYVLVRNPWGRQPVVGEGVLECCQISTSAEFDGCQSDERLDSDLGASWVPWSLFTRIFNRAYFCLLALPKDCVTDLNWGLLSTAGSVAGSWKRSDASCGGASHCSTFRSNPMYRLTLRGASRAHTVRLLVCVSLSDVRVGRDVVHTRSGSSVGDNEFQALGSNGESEGLDAKPSQGILKKINYPPMGY